MLQNDQPICSGSILNNKTIVTSGKCCNLLDFQNNTKIIAGELDRNHESGREEELNIENFIIHPNYENETMKNDICLIFLQEDIIFNDFIDKITLNTNEKGNIVCQMSGWGLANVSSIENLSLILNNECSLG